MASVIVYVDHPIQVAGSDQEGWRLEVDGSYEEVAQLRAWLAAKQRDLDLLLGPAPASPDRLGAGVEGDRVAT